MVVGAWTSVQLLFSVVSPTSTLPHPHPHPPALHSITNPKALSFQFSLRNHKAFKCDDPVGTPYHHSLHMGSPILFSEKCAQNFGKLWQFSVGKSRWITAACSGQKHSDNGQVEMISVSEDAGISCKGDLIESLKCKGTASEVEYVVSERESASLLGAKASPDTLVTQKEGIFASVVDTLILISPFFFWGTAMVAMKPVLPKAGPLFVAAFRLIPAGALLIAFAALRGRKQPSGLLAWSTILVFGLVDAACFQGFLAEGLRRTSAGLGSVIIDSQPLTVAVLAAILFGETIGALGVVGLITGIIGLLLLEVPVDVLKRLLTYEGFRHIFSSIDSHYNASSEETWSIWDSGEWWMLLAAQSMAIGTVMVRWVCQYSDSIMATGWHMILGGIPLLALSAIQHDPALNGHFQDLELNDWLSLLYTSVFGSAISYGVFFYNARKGSLTKLSSLTFLTPMFAALFGYFVLGEVLTPLQLLGATVTLSSIYLVNAKSGTFSEESDETRS